MKKIIAILASVFITLSAFSQSSPIIAVGTQLSINKLGEVVEIGAQSGNNRLTVVGEHFETIQKDFFQTGVKYTRIFPSKVVDLLGQGAIKVNVSEGAEHALSFEPGIGAELKLGKSVAVQTSLVTILRENTDLLNPTRLKAGVSFLLKL